MVALLISVGAAGVLASLFALGFGFANNGFDLGNTLIMAGASGLGSSLVVIGLAAVVRELKRVASAQSAHHLPERSPRAVEAMEVPMVPGRAPVAPRAPYPPKPMAEPPGREARMAEPRAAEPYDEPEPERRPNIFAAARSEPPMMAEPEVPPMSPMRPVVPPSMAPPPPAAEPSYEPKFGPADILARLGGGRGRPETARPAQRPPIEEDQPDLPAMEPAPPPPPRPPRGGMFEPGWPAERPTRSAEAVARAPKADPRPEPKYEPKAEPKYEPKRPRAEPPPLQSAVVPPPPVVEPPPPEPRTATILKSGVIDGMAYTLYTDGSIEAQLPQGTMHFASIEELRMHLEQNG